MFNSIFLKTNYDLISQILLGKFQFDAFFCKVFSNLEFIVKNIFAVN